MGIFESRAFRLRVIRRPVSSKTHHVEIIDQRNRKHAEHHSHQVINTGANRLLVIKDSHLGHIGAGRCRNRKERDPENRNVLRKPRQKSADPQDSQGQKRQYNEPEEGDEIGPFVGKYPKQAASRQGHSDHQHGDRPHHVGQHFYRRVHRTRQGNPGKQHENTAGNGDNIGI